MMRAFAWVGLVALCSGVAFGQSTETTPKFEAADIHASRRTSQPFLQGPFAGDGRYILRYATMADLVSTAYGVDPDKVFGGPSWLELDRFDVVAKVPAGSTPETRKLMLQALLADRFKLVVHNGDKPMQVFVLTAGKHKLKEASGTGDSGCRPQPRPQNIEPGTITYIEATCHNMTMAAFAETVHQMAGGYLTSPVVDSTGLKGSWDFDLKWTGRGALAAAGADGISIFDAVDKQLCLKLELQKIPQPAFVVDSVDRKPTDNPPDVAKIFPPLPTEFDVAEIKPSEPTPAGERGGRPPEIKNGKVYLPGITLKNLIFIAWDLNGDEMLAGAPKWLDSDRFDIIAKAPSGMTLGELTQTSRSIPIDVDALRPMIRALVMDRFKMKVHTEDRPVPAYSLTAAKPKLQKADPAGRTRWKEGAAPDPKDKNASLQLGRLVNCQNMTMAQFADLLPGIAPGYIHNDVVDATGLEGNWDFTFTFSPAGALLGGGGRGGDGPQTVPGAGSAASDPSGGLSLFDALSRQLGLKLEMQKRPMPVLVIDHVEQKPMDN